jgi:hypothetical protein
MERPARPADAGRARRPAGGGRRVAAALVAALIAVAAGPAAAHHVGAYVPRDNEVSANFKQIKFAIQARKMDVAVRLFEAGAVRAEMRAQRHRLPPGLEEATRAALAAGDGPRAERGLMIFFAALARDLAAEADRRLADASEPPEARVAAARKFLEAIWRYYNLVDFAATQNDPKAAVAVRLAFDEAEGRAQGGSAPDTASSESKRAAARPVTPPDPDQIREPLQRMGRALTGLIETSTTAMR